MVHKHLRSMKYSGIMILKLICMIFVEISLLSKYSFFKVHPRLKDRGGLSQLMYFQALELLLHVLLNLHGLLSLRAL